MNTLDRRVLHFGGNRMISIARQPIDACADQEMGAEIMGHAEELVDVTLTVADMHATARIPEQDDGLPDVVQPAETLLLLDGNPRGIDLLPQRCRMCFGVE